MEKAQRKNPGAVAERRDEHRPAAPHHLGVQDLALHHRSLAWQHGADRHAAGAVLVAGGQQEHEVLRGAHAELLEPARQGRPDAAQAGDRVFGRDSHTRGRRLSPGYQDGVHLDARALGQRRHLHGHAGRVRRLEHVFHHAVHGGEVGEIGKIHGEAHHVVEACRRPPPQPPRGY
jgi:hypothetical protein